MEPRTDDTTRQRILEAAGLEFARKGYQDTTVRDILRQARVSNQAAINYYFGDKEKLYLETVRRAHQCRVEEVPTPSFPPNTPPEVKLRAFVHTMMTRMVKEKSPDWQVQILMRELIQPTAACTEMVRDFIRPHFTMLLAVLDEVLPAEVSKEKRHLIAFSIVGQCLHHRVARPVIEILVGTKEYQTYHAEKLAEHITDFSLSALGLKTPLNGGPVAARNEP